MIDDVLQVSSLSSAVGSSGAPEAPPPSPHEAGQYIGTGAVVHKPAWAASAQLNPLNCPTPLPCNPTSSSTSAAGSSPPTSTALSRQTSAKRLNWLLGSVVGSITAPQLSQYGRNAARHLNFTCKSYLLVQSSFELQ